jgi:ligand-binding SRPBCC domain-containing protein
MPVIILTTIIYAPIERVFDLARNIDLHQQSMQHTAEKAVAGRLSGLIEEGETVTWEAKHFFKIRRLTSKIVAMKAPFYFRDEMIAGDFSLLHHDHYFSSESGGTRMKDVFTYRCPYRFAGRIAEWVFLNRYLKKLLAKRNEMIKTMAETAHA